MTLGASEARIKKFCNYMLKISPKCGQQNTMLVAQTLKRRHILSDTGYRMDIYMQELKSLSKFFPYLNSYLIFYDRGQLRFFEM